MIFYCRDFQLQELMDVRPKENSVYIRSSTEPFDDDMRLDQESEKMAVALWFNKERGRMESHPCFWSRLRRPNQCHEDEDMKCLSMKQPYAELLVSGKKTIELGTWNTKFMILVAIRRCRNF